MWLDERGKRLAVGQVGVLGTGLVRVERSEPANSTFLTGGTQTLELVAWE